MILANGLVMDADFRLRHCDLLIEDGKIVKIEEKLEGDDKIDMTGRYILPGFIDTHIHGAYGVRIDDEKPDLSVITHFQATQGITSIAITTFCPPFDELLKQFDIVADFAREKAGCKIAGIHAEGPFLCARAGKNTVAPTIEKLNMMIEHSQGLLKIITVSPEMENAEEIIRYAVSKGITVSLGHTDADYETTRRVIEAGATQATHTFNAVRAYHHREPGVLGAVLTNPEVVCEMICDYVHLHPATVKLIYMLKGAERINLVSDSTTATGTGMTEYVVNGVTRYVIDGVSRSADGTISGSVKTLYDDVKNLLGLGIPLEHVSRMASLNPARSLKMDHLTGSITIGKMADLVVLDQNYDVEVTYVDGECVYRRNQAW